MQRLILLVCLVIASFEGSAQVTKPVEDAVEKLRVAMIDADTAALLRLTSDRLSYGHSSGSVEDKRGFISGIASGRSDFVTIVLTDQTIQLSGNTAIVRHHLEATSNDNGQPGSVSLGILQVWQKQGKNWKLIARQAVKTSH